MKEREKGEAGMERKEKKGGTKGRGETPEINFWLCRAIERSAQVPQLMRKNSSCFRARRGVPCRHPDIFPGISVGAAWGVGGLSQLRLHIGDTTVSYLCSNI